LLKEQPKKRRSMADNSPARKREREREREKGERERE
jgi:hypothetical protein